MLSCLDQIITHFKRHHPRGDLKPIRQAFAFAKKMHFGQKRRSGEPYFFHPLAVAYTLAQHGLDQETIIAGLLHDVIDDTLATLEQIQAMFGPKVAFLVKGVSRLGKVKYRGQEKYAENLRRMLLAMAQDIRIVMIKLADRLHNMQTIKALPKAKQKRIAQETLDIYAPLADRLGIWQIKSYLEDLCFPILRPKEYKKLVVKVAAKFQKRRHFLKSLRPEINSALKQAGLQDFLMEARAKHFWSLYKKLERYQGDLNRIYDLVAMRIIVNNVSDCYRALGIIHKLYRPMPNRIKDYIATPKANGYQSLHTTVFATGGQPVEIQIRTKKIHQQAEYGIVAHWAFAEQGKPKAGVRVKQEYAWINQLRQWQKNEDWSSPEFLDNLKIDFFQDRIFALTPKGDVIDLPEGACLLDFAYQIHTDLGDKCQGGKIENKMIGLDDPLPSGEIIEILTGRHQHPHRDWLKIAKTTHAKAKIRHWLRQHGQAISLPAKKSFLHALGRTVSQTAKKILPKKKPAIIIGGQKDLLVKIAQCCRPQKNDAVIGYITQGRGISVHKKTCPSIKRQTDKKRLISVGWH